MKFEVQADYDKVIRLKEEIDKLQQALLTLSPDTPTATISKIETQLASAKGEFGSLTQAAMLAGAEVEHNFKKKLLDATQSVNGFAETILTQKGYIQGLQSELRKLTEELDALGSKDPNGEDFFRANDLKGKIAELKAEIGEEKDALAGLSIEYARAKLTVKELNDEYKILNSGAKNVTVTATTTTNDDEAPARLFRTEEQYQAAETLKAKIAEVQEQIANFNGTEDALEPLKESLQSMQPQLQRMNLEAQEAAAKLGADLGSKAVEASTTLYELNAAISEQKGKIDELTTSVNDATSALENLQGSEDHEAINNAQSLLDALNSSLEEETTTLLNLQAAQVDASAQWAALSQEIETHDSVFVKMLGGQEKYKDIMNQLPTEFKSAIGGIQGMTGAAKAFIATPIGAIIAAIVLVLQALKTWLDSSVEGQMAFAEISGYVSGVLGQLKEIVITVGKAIFNAFKDPKKAVSDLWDAIKTNIVNRFKALGSLASHVGDMITAAFTPGKSVSDAMKNIKNDLIQLGTGVENLTDKMSEYVKGVNEAAKANARLAKEEKQLDIDQHEWSKRNAELNKVKATAQGVMYDTSKSSAERKKALKEYEAAVKEQYDKEREFADKRIAIQEERMSLTTNDIAAENKLRDLQAARLNLDAQEAREISSLQRRKNGIANAGKSEANAAKKDADAQQKLADDLIKMREKNLKMEISQMDDAKEKRLAEIEANYDAQKHEIEKKARELATANTKAKMPGVGEDGLTDEQRQEIERSKQLNESGYKKQKADIFKEEATAMRDFLKEYGSFQQQKLAIAQEYAEKIKKAQTEGEKLSLAKERDNQLASLKAAELRENIDWSVVFGEFGGMFHDVISPTLEELKNYIKTDEFKQSDADSQQSIIEAMRQMETAVGSSSRVSFEKLGEEISAYKDALSSLATAEEGYKTAIEELAIAQEAYEVALESGSKIALSAAAAELEATKQSVTAAENNLKVARNNVSQTKEVVSSTAAALKAAMDNVIGGLQKLSGGSISGAYEGIIQFGKGVKALDKMPKGISDAMGEVSEKLENVPIIGWIAQIIDLFKDGLKVVVTGIVDAVFNAVSGIIGDVLNFKDGLIVSLGKSLFNGIGNIFKSIFTLGGMFDWIGGRESDKHYERDMEKLTASNERLEAALTRLSNTMENASLAEVGSIADTQKDFLNNKEENLSEQIYRSGAAYKKKNIFGNGGRKSGLDYLVSDINKADWRSVGAAIGKNWDNLTVSQMANSFLKLSADEMKKVAEDLPSVWMLITQALEKGYKDATQFLEEYISIPDQLREIEESVANRLTSTTFDSVKDSFKSMLLDMSSDRDEFIADFEKGLQGAVINSMMDEKYNDRLKKWYENFSEAMSDTMLTSSERDRLKAEYDAIVDDALRERDAFKSAFGWGEETESQNATGGYSTQLSEDTGSEIVGRMTAAQDALYRIESLGVERNRLLSVSENQDRQLSIAELTNSQVEQIMNQQAAAYTVHVDSRRILAESFLELQQIRENTDAIVKPINSMKESLEKIEKNTKEMI